MVLAAMSLSLSAQEPADTLPVQALDEVVIEAPKVIRKSDMDVFYPSKSAMANSANGMQIVKNLMIPAVMVNEVLGTVTIGGNPVQIRINGREASVDQIRELLPETVRKVEWIDNPGLRYGGAAAVLNIVVANPSVGGSVMADAQQALTEGFGRYDMSLKLNNGRSQWGISSRLHAVNNIPGYREYQETFTYPDGMSLTRTESPLSGNMNHREGYMLLDYSYVKPDTTVVWVGIQGDKYWSDEGTMFDGRLRMSDGSRDIFLHDLTDKNGFTPSIMTYLEQHFANNQLVAVGADVSFYGGRTFRDYTERDCETLEYISDVHMSVKDRNSVYGVTADYIKKWRKSRITAGISYTANRNRSKYENLDNEVFHQKQDKLYFYTEFFYRINKVTLTAGLGAQYTSFRLRETRQGNDSWNVRPKATVTYRPSESSQFSLDFTSWQSAPSLSETNIAPQQVDGIQWQIGNPDLKTASTHRLTARYQYSYGRVNGQFGARAHVCPDAIAPLLFWEDGRLITTYENSKGWRNLTFWLSPQIDVIPGWLTLSGTLRYRVEKTQGSGYRHCNSNWYGDVTAMAFYRGFTLLFQYYQASKSLWGEKILWGETMSLLALSYRWKQWQFAAELMCPFVKYDRGSRSLNRYNTNLMHIRTDIAPLPLLHIGYNLQWGRQKRGVNKIVNVDANVSRTSVAGK